IVDEANKVKLPETKPPEPEPVAAKEEDQTTPQEKAEQEEEDAYSKSNDPVRMYLRKMGSVSLLTREGEVEIAKRIEDGEKEVLRALLACRLAVAEILDIGNKLKAGKLRIREVVKDAPEEPQGEGVEEVVEEPAEGESAIQQLNQSEL